MVQAQGRAAPERRLREPDRRLRGRRRAGLPEVSRHARRSEARRAGRRGRTGWPRRAAWRSPSTPRSSRFANRARDITGGLEYDRAGSLNAIGFTVSVDLPFHDRNQGNIAHAKVGIAQATELQEFARSTVLTDVVNAYADVSDQREGRWRSISPATSIRRSSRSTSRPTSISRAAARCSTCSTPSARIGRRSSPIARRWRRT